MRGRVAYQIHFDGDWTDTERRVLESAIADAEGLQGGAAGEGSAEMMDGSDQSWVCYCKRMAGLSVYLAHRAGWMRVLHAYGATELGFKILLFGEEEAGSGGYTA